MFQSAAGLSTGGIAGALLIGRRVRCFNPPPVFRPAESLIRPLADDPLHCFNPPPVFRPAESRRCSFCRQFCMFQSAAGLSTGGIVVPSREPCRNVSIRRRSFDRRNLKVIRLGGTSFQSAAGLSTGGIRWLPKSKAGNRLRWSIADLQQRGAIAVLSQPCRRPNSRRMPDLQLPRTPRQNRRRLGSANGRSAGPAVPPSYHERAVHVGRLVRHDVRHAYRRRGSRSGASPRAPRSIPPAGAQSHPLRRPDKALENRLLYSLPKVLATLGHLPQPLAARGSRRRHVVNDENFHGSP